MLSGTPICREAAPYLSGAHACGIRYYVVAETGTGFGSNITT